MKLLIILALLMPSFHSEPLVYIRQEDPKIYGVVSAYTPRVQETDDSPLITASNKRVRDGIVANNCLKFKSVVNIAGRNYTVEDRMNKRYSCQYFDIFMWSVDEALEFGRQNLEVHVVYAAN